MAEGYDGKASAHYLAVKEHKARLVKLMQHCLVAIANEFHSNDLIGDYELGKVTSTSTGKDNYEKAVDVMRSVLDKIQYNFRLYTVLLDILKGSELKDVGTDIETTRVNLATNKADSGNQVGKVLPSNSPLLSYSPSGKELESFEGRDSAFQEPLTTSTFSDQDPPRPPGVPVQQSISAGNDIEEVSPQAVTDTGTSGGLIVSSSSFIDTSHVECKKKLAHMKREKENVEADVMEVEAKLKRAEAGLACLTSIKEEDDKLMEEGTRKLSQKQEDLKKAEEQIEDLVKCNEGMAEKIEKLENTIDELRLCDSQHQKEMADKNESLRTSEEENAKLREDCNNLKKELEELKVKGKKSSDEVDQLVSQLAFLQLDKSTVVDQCAVG